jgi:hypothetical protein
MSRSDIMDNREAFQDMAIFMAKIVLGVSNPEQRLASIMVDISHVHDSRRAVTRHTVICKTEL